MIENSDYNNLAETFHVSPCQEKGDTPCNSCSLRVEEIRGREAWRELQLLYTTELAHVVILLADKALVHKNSQAKSTFGEMCGGVFRTHSCTQKGWESHVDGGMAINRPFHFNLQTFF